MTKIENLEIKTDILSSKRYDEVVMLYLNDNLLFRLIDLSVKDTTFKYLDRLAAAESIKVIVIMAPPQGAGREEYMAFYRKFYSNMDRSAVLRMYNAINQLVLKIIETPKLFIHAFQGKSLLTFLNVGLACDYRIAADDTLFQNPCMELGLLPKGGGAYFLTKRLGPGKAYEVLLSCEDITAGKALNLGLVEKAVPREDLEETALITAQSYAHQSINSLAGVKRLISGFYSDLGDFLEKENQELIKIFDSGALLLDKQGKAENHERAGSA